MPYRSRAKAAAMQRQRYRDFLAVGLCGKCGKRPCEEGRTACTECLDLVTGRAVARYYKARRAVFDYYGRECVCCGEIEPLFLTIDHVNGGGSQHLKETGRDLYSWLARNGFPKGFQVLCASTATAAGRATTASARTNSGGPKCA